MKWSIIKNDEQYYIALERLDEIFDAANHPENTDEFDLITLLVNKYEEEKFAIEPADPIEVIKMKMDYMHLNQKDLIPYFGSKATVSKIFSYKAPLTLKHIWLLSDKLNLPLEVLAKPYRLEHWGFMKKFEDPLKPAKAGF